MPLNSTNRPCGILGSHHSTNRYNDNSTLVLMHSGIVNGYWLLCDTHIVQNNLGELQLYFTHYSPFTLFLVCHSDSPRSLLGASIVNNLKSTADLVL